MNTHISGVTADIRQYGLSALMNTIVAAAYRIAAEKAERAIGYYDKCGAQAAYNDAERIDGIVHLLTSS